MSARHRAGHNPDGRTVQAIENAYWAFWRAARKPSRLALPAAPTGGTR